MKTHLSLATTDLPKSIEFYSALLNIQPKKRFSDYALFVVNEPPLELALEAVASTESSTDDHYGICVETIDEVNGAIARLKDMDLISSIERAQACCYANQTKVWAVDPAGRRWEVYTVHEDVNDRGAPGASCGEDAPCCAV